MKRLVATVLVLMLSFATEADNGSVFFAGVDALPADEQFRQLSLMLMVAVGVDENLLAALMARTEGDTMAAEDQDAADFDFDQYTTPLIRIVDQESMLVGATRLFLFTRTHAEGITERLLRLHDQHSDSAQPFPVSAMGEDAIIIRNAIADSVDFAIGIDTQDPASASLSSHYRARTIYLRNNLEYESFALELKRITNEAVASVGGRTEAYERMFDNEVDASAINKKIEAAEFSYGWDRDFDKRAAKLAEEILENIWEMESDIDP